MELKPVLFFGHGSPLNALLENGYTQTWRRMGQELRKPKAILMISAHWFVPGTGVTISTSPRTIHDFGGFPQELYQVQYPAPGDPQLAQRVQQLLAPMEVVMDTAWGFDHGTWSVLGHVYPEADVPVVQLSIDWTKPAAFHFEIGRRIAPLREEGVLILGSGNVVHNLRAYTRNQADQPYEWAAEFEARTKELILAEEYRPLIAYERLTKEAALCIPTPDHYLPLLYILGAKQPGESVRFPIEGIDGRSVSMLTVEIGAPAGAPQGV